MLSPPNSSEVVEEEDFFTSNNENPPPFIKQASLFDVRDDVQLSLHHHDDKKKEGAEELVKEEVVTTVQIEVIGKDAKCSLVGAQTASDGKETEPRKVTTIRTVTRKTFKVTGWKGLKADGQGSRAMAWLQSLMAGWLSAVGYVVLSNLYIGPMSGNTITLASSISSRNWPLALSRFAALGVYMFGCSLATAIRELFDIYKIKYVTIVLFILEIICLLLFFLFGYFLFPTLELRTITTKGFYIIMIPAVLSLSFQMISLQRVGTMPMSSIVITTTLSKAVGEFVSFLFYTYRYYILNIKMNFLRNRPPSPRSQRLSLLNKQNQDHHHLNSTAEMTTITTVNNLDHTKNTKTIKHKTYLVPSTSHEEEKNKNQTLLHEYQIKRNEFLKSSSFYCIMWLAYFIGALIGGALYMEAKIKIFSLIPVIFILFCLIIADIMAHIHEKKMKEYIEYLGSMVCVSQHYAYCMHLV